MSNVAEMVDEVSHPNNQTEVTQIVPSFVIRNEGREADEVVHQKHGHDFID